MILEKGIFIYAYIQASWVEEGLEHVLFRKAASAQRDDYIYAEHLPGIHEHGIDSCRNPSLLRHDRGYDAIVIEQGRGLSGLH